MISRLKKALHVFHVPDEFEQDAHIVQTYTGGRLTREQYERYTADWPAPGSKGFKLILEFHPEKVHQNYSFDERGNHVPLEHVFAQAAYDILTRLNDAGIVLDVRPMRNTLLGYARHQHMQGLPIEIAEPYVNFLAEDIELVKQDCDRIKAEHAFIDAHPAA